MAVSDIFDVDNIISKLLEVKASSSSDQKMEVPDSAVRDLCLKAKEVFLSQPVLLDIESPLTICGDIYGQFDDLLRWFDLCGYPPGTRYLFLGNFINIGRRSLEVACLLLAFKVKYPQQFFILRGKHECASMSRIFGFYDHCKRPLNIKTWKIFMDCFNCLPVAAIVGGKIFCCHGGLSPHLKSIDQIRAIQRPCDIPDAGLVCDLVCAGQDVHNYVHNYGWCEDKTPGVSFLFGEDVVENFLKDFNLKMICRADTLVDKGYEYIAHNQLVTLFSTPNYKENDNDGAVMTVDSDCSCSLKTLKPFTSSSQSPAVDTHSTYSN